MRNQFLLGAVAIAAVTAGCSGGALEGPQETKSPLARDMSPNVSPEDEQALVAGNSDFAFDVYKALAAGNSQNQFFSPYSISSALAMTYAGAGGTTAIEMATALHFTLPGERLHPAFDAIDLALDADNETGADADAGAAKALQLHVANSLWGTLDEKFEQPFLDTLAQNYGAGIWLTDFAGNAEGSRGKINDWVSSETNGKIRDLLPPGSVDAATRLVLVDAIYFDGSWAMPFSESLTEPAQFTKMDGSQTSVSMMHADLSTSFASTDSYDAVELPYMGEVSMDIVMPKAGTMATFESTLTGDSFQAIATTLKPGEVEVSLPKFGYQGGTISLKKLLETLGMVTAFTGGADFTAMDASGSLQIADVLHQAYLSVDEAGSEAAAATAVTVDAGSADTGPPKPPPSIVIDHPFALALRDRVTGTILFAGRITDPSQ